MPSRCLRHLLLLTLTLTLALGLAGPGPAAAATFVVDNCSDTPIGGTLSLREAVAMAAASGDTSDTITFPAGSCVITLAGAAGDDANVSGDIDILTKILTLQGSGPDLTIIDGGAVDRVFEIGDDVSPVTVTIRNLTIRNGDATQNPGMLFQGGGGILLNAQANATLENVHISGNTGTQGGGLYNDGMATATLTRVTISGNTGVTAAGEGGGIYNNTNGTLTITNSTISGNAATSDGGGISNNGPTLALTSVTITNNTADSDNSAGGTGGGITNNFATSVTLRNTIVAGNLVGTSGGNANCQANPNALTSQGNNLFGSNTECTGITTDVEAANPLLGPLADNGGDTPTHALLAGSPALNAGASTGCPATDQRGLLRPARGVSGATAACDIGAFELQLEQAGLGLSLNQTSFTTGQTLRATVTASNTGDAIVVDVLFGIVVPASAAASLGCPAGVAPIAFITQVSPAAVAFRCSNASLATFPALLEDNTLQPTPQFTVPNFFSVAFPAQTPSGGYLLFLALVRAGSLDDGTLDPGDIIEASAVPFVIQ